jgi:hypothetical protein
LFLNYENIDIARKLKKLYSDLNIVYISSTNEGIEYDEDIQNKKYKEKHDDNFYYYDQTHVIGSDLKQANSGHVIIIIKETTRMSEFAQAIFRFRKINKGTVLSVLLLVNKKLSSEKYSNFKLYSGNDEEDLYKLLLKNEDAFNMHQETGLKYQLLKTIVRKNELIVSLKESPKIDIDNSIYSETNLLPEYMLLTEPDKNELLTIIQNNIIKNLKKYIGQAINIKINASLLPDVFLNALVAVLFMFNSIIL